MRYMGWSWPDYCALPASYVAVLFDMIRDEQRAGSTSAAASSPWRRR